LDTGRCIINFDGSVAGSRAFSINNNGQVVGTSCRSVDFNLPHVFLWSSASGTQQDLGRMVGPMSPFIDTFSSFTIGGAGAVVINDSGQIAGSKEIEFLSGSGLHCFSWSSGQDLGTLDGAHSFGWCLVSGINSNGQFVGSDVNVEPTGDGGFRGVGPHAFLWSGGMQDLGTLPGHVTSRALGINDSGQVVGVSSSGNVDDLTLGSAFLWSSGSGMQDLRLGIGSAARGINNSGQVVGTRSGGAFLWSNGVLTDLNTLPAVQAAGWFLSDAYAINDAGQIVGRGFNGNSSMFLLTPITPGIKIKVVPTNGAIESSSTIASLEPDKSITLVARVLDENGQLVPNANVRLEATAVPGSGGHDHHDANRPNGSLGGSSGTPYVVTGNTGTTGFVFPFTASEISGGHKITATCTDRTCPQEGPDTVRVMVSGLQELGPGTDYELIGQTASHTQNHYSTASLIASLRILANAYAKAFPGDRLAYNDISLQFGGLFDVGKDKVSGALIPWRTPHVTHRLGTEVDLRLVPTSYRQALRHLIKLSGISRVRVEDTPPHWHLSQ